MRSEILQLMQLGERYEGTQTPSFFRLNRLAKGFRRGELVVFTGPTGSGKTTLLSQLSLDFAQQDVPTLWGSFEIKNSRLLVKMLHQYHKRGPRLDPSEVETVADEFESLPLYFLNFHGSTEMTQVFEALEVAVYKHDVQHIIIDNLQFMMPNHRGFDKFDALDEAITSFRRFATERHVNIVLVIHPKKEDDRLALGVSSIFGSAKATQEADMVLILQRLEKNVFLDLKKNRFDGDVGRVYLDYSQILGGFHEIDAPLKEPEGRRKWSN